MQARAIRGGLMFTRSVTNASMTVKMQRPKGQIDWSPEGAIYASNFELVFQISVQCARGTLTVQAGAIRGGLMFTRSVTNASTTVRKQRPLK